VDAQTSWLDEQAVKGAENDAPDEAPDDAPDDAAA
jgi:hypothetical protein